MVGDGNINTVTPVGGNDRTWVLVCSTRYQHFSFPLPPSHSRAENVKLISMANSFTCPSGPTQFSNSVIVIEFYRYLAYGHYRISDSTHGSGNAGGWNIGLIISVDIETVGPTSSVARCIAG